jgi:hypothetical protein
MSRQGRLREEYATWYSTIPAGRWQLAEALRRIVLRQLRHGCSWAPGPRILSGRHSELQGGSAAAPPQASDVERRRMVPRVTPRQGPTDAVEGSH